MSPASVVLSPSRRYIKVVVAFGPPQSAEYGYRAPALDELVQRVLLKWEP